MSERDSRLYLSDILDSGTAIQEFVKGLSFEQFCNDRKTFSAVIREFEIIGEAVGKLSDALKRKHPDDLPALMDAVREILRKQNE